MLGDTEKSSSFGTGLEQQARGFLMYTMEDHLVMWEQSINRSLVPETSDLYVTFNRSALLRSDVASRWDAYVKALQWGVISPDEVRVKEDMNPRPGGDRYYEPPNTRGTPAKEGQSE